MIFISKNINRGVLHLPKYGPGFCRLCCNDAGQCFLCPERDAYYRALCEHDGMPGEIHALRDEPLHLELFHVKQFQMEREVACAEVHGKELRL